MYARVFTVHTLAFCVPHTNTCTLKRFHLCWFGWFIRGTVCESRKVDNEWTRSNVFVAPKSGNHVSKCFWRVPALAIKRCILPIIHIDAMLLTCDVKTTIRCIMYMFLMWTPACICNQFETVHLYDLNDNFQDKIHTYGMRMNLWNHSETGHQNYACVYT